MVDYAKRFLIVVILAVCIGLLFMGGKIGHASQLAGSPPKENWLWPANGVVTDNFGTREGTHKGIDIAAELNTDILASDAGTISKSYYSSSYGNVIFVKHSTGFETIYAHLNKRMVKEGDEVKQGEVIGKMGNTGRSRGVHLHFELHNKEWTADKRNALNPMVALTKFGNDYPGEFNKEKESIAVSRQLEEKTASSPNSNALEAQSTSIHIVQKGETLYSIAKVHSTDVNSLMKVNQLQNDTIRPGAALMVGKNE
ncbi:M23 family metallopeptidase [Bacillus sp. V5-8f]|uniref:M23 family metallopeptidase n=1 Tax=Bacillus sp. V5-8f TaxID=2053044 RepID=UPI000C78A8DB|nr:M23 family metallopeptidase [Bacillus sp. V5-8f]PLT34835.1 peptidase M23 [Bacillus sp. V5-8f]